MEAEASVVEVSEEVLAVVLEEASIHKILITTTIKRTAKEHKEALVPQVSEVKATSQQAQEVPTSNFLQ